MGNDITSGKLGSIHFRSQGGSTYDDGFLPDGNPASSIGPTGASGEAPRELAGAEGAVEEVS